MYGNYSVEKPHGDGGKKKGMETDGDTEIEDEEYSRVGEEGYGSGSNSGCGSGSRSGSGRDREYGSGSGSGLEVEERSFFGSNVVGQCFKS